MFMPSWNIEQCLKYYDVSQVPPCQKSTWIVSKRFRIESEIILSIRGGMRSRGGHAWQGGMCGRGHAWWGNGRGACVAGETTTAADGMHPTGMHSCSFLMFGGGGTSLSWYHETLKLHWNSKWKLITHFILAISEVILQSCEWFPIL